MDDNDWDMPVRVITEEEAELLPKTHMPRKPDFKGKVELMRQVAVERIKGHPAHKEVEPDYEPVDTGIYS